MQYIPKLKPQEIKENHKRFSQRILLYKNRGLDFLRSREFILEKVYPLKGEILEIGTGTGYTTLALAKAGYKFASVDKDRQSLKIAALNLAYENLLSRVKFYIMDGTCLAFADRSFKNIIIVNLFHHIDKIDKMLIEADRVLYANGRLILADFNKEGMRIVDSVHKEEGRIHINSGVSRDYVYFYFHSLGYDIKGFDDRYHWILMAEKRIKQ